jgi:hypothetical protein
VAWNKRISTPPSLGYAYTADNLPSDFVGVVYHNDLKPVFCPNARR